jgi:tetratricopeptide (TPR) repeat protein
MIALEMSTMGSQSSRSQTVISPARKLFDSYRFKEAVEAYKRQLREDSNDELLNTFGLGDALVAAGEYSEAISYLKKADEYLRQEPGKPGEAVLLSICHWLIGERIRALEIIKDLVIGVRDHKIHYTDFAGGTSYGVIYCYMAATLQRPSDIALATKYLEKLSTRRHINTWPGPATLFLLGKVSFSDAMKDATGSADLTQAKNIAEQDLMSRRKLTSLLFAAGVERRVAGDEPGSHMYMTECASLTTPLIEYEWHLARAEANVSF